MTAEVAIVNASAVALAADSAVTISEQKTYNSAIKLFSLSKVAPVGIMIFGNANLMDVPWETLIKDYRKQLGCTVFGRVREYAEDFIRYLQNHPTAFPEQRQADFVRTSVAGYYTFIREQLWDRFQGRTSIPLEEVTEAFRSLVVEHHRKLSDSDFCDGMTEDDLLNIRRKYRNDFHSIRKETFEKLPIEPGVARLLNDIAALIMVKDLFSALASGIVVAGFGEEELYPCVLTYRVEGVVENKLKYKYDDRKSFTVRSGNECAILPFAQEDMVATFMDGINPAIRRILESYLRNLFTGLPEVVQSLQGNCPNTKEFEKVAQQLLETFFRELEKHIQQNYTHPVLRMVMALPKNELAEMAEAFVNLTAFKRKVTDSMETVGGPVDVAVISKGDGLVWVKRKHYFPRELNQQFFANYFREVDCEETTKTSGGLQLT